MLRIALFKAFVKPDRRIRQKILALFLWTSHIIHALMPEGQFGSLTIVNDIGGLNYCLITSATTSLHIPILTQYPLFIKEKHRAANMILTAIIMSLILFVDHGLGLVYRASSNVTNQLEAYSVTVPDVNLGFSSATEFVTITIACVTTKRSWNASVPLTRLLPPMSAGNNSDSRTSSTQRQPIVAAPPQTGCTTKSSSSLIFDHNSASKLFPAPTASAYTFTGSGRRRYVRILDLLVVFFFGAIELA